MTYDHILTAAKTLSSLLKFYVFYVRVRVSPLLDVHLVTII